MATFQTVPCTEELFLKLGRENYDFAMSVRFEAEGRIISVVQFEVFSYEIGESAYFYGLRRIMPVMPNDLIACSLGPFDGEKFLEGFKLFAERLKLFDSGEKTQIIMDETFTDVLIPYFHENGWNNVQYPSINYYMTEEQEKLLMNAPALQLPDGYTLGSSQGSYAKIITNAYIWKKPRELEMTQLKLAAFPSTCILFRDEPVAFQMVHPSGMLNQLFVMEEHRGKGLGHIVERDLCRKLIKKEMFVFKTVLNCNSSVLRGTDESPYWTKKKKADGSPLIKIYMDIWPEKTYSH